VPWLARTSATHSSTMIKYSGFVAVIATSSAAVIQINQARALNIRPRKCCVLRIPYCTTEYSTRHPQALRRAIQPAEAIARPMLANINGSIESASPATGKTCGTGAADAALRAGVTGTRTNVAPLSAGIACTVAKRFAPGMLA